jgi:hypothetical protein
VTLEDCNHRVRNRHVQWHPLGCPPSCKKLLNSLGAAERAYLAGRRRESAALGLGESVPGGEHDGCDGYQRKMNLLECRW